MKKYIYLLFAAAAMLFVGCSDDDDTATVDAGVVGEWQLIQWNGDMAEDFVVYLDLQSDGTFQLYQQVEHSYYDHFTGSFTADGGLLEGRYSDGITWAYGFVLSDGGYTLTLTDQKSNEVSVYTRSTIPAEVRGAQLTRSQTTGKRFL